MPAAFIRRSIWKMISSSLVLRRSGRSKYLACESLRRALLNERPLWMPSALIRSVTEAPSTRARSGWSNSRASLTEAWRRPHAGLVKKIDRLPPDQLAAAEKREGQDRLAYFPNRLNGFVHRGGATVDGLEIPRVR